MTNRRCHEPGLTARLSQRSARAFPAPRAARSGIQPASRPRSGIASAPRAVTIARRAHIHHRAVHTPRDSVLWLLTRSTGSAPGCGGPSAHCSLRRSGRPSMTKGGRFTRRLASQSPSGRISRRTARRSRRTSSTEGLSPEPVAVAPREHENQRFVILDLAELLHSVLLESGSS